MYRREFLRTAGGTASAVTVAAGSDTAQQSENTNGGGNESGGGGGESGPIDYGGWLDDANGWEEGGTVDQRGNKAITVKVGVGKGGLAFEPVAVHVDEGTKIKWESAGHNVHAMSGADFQSEIQGPESTYEWTAEGRLVVNYQCDPHAGQGMLAAIAIGDNVPRAAPAGLVKPAVSNGAKSLAIATITAMVSTLAQQPGVEGGILNA
ncbi:plastocyanin/azurin family copper-binding protein [Halomarina pelagica]|uniref:plastocyanin/azurin family copper-binding protein n=1 Tax=Halomarina pelagica TaxID=2961599 RepID=UPI0020C300A6|nr:plastocyanin/azurin family copper-binding protein [Halomarina sp. BND7]